MFTSIGGIEEGNNPVPEYFVLSQNYPNPFNPSTVIEYSLSEYSRQYAVGSKEKQSLNQTEESPLPRRACPAHSAGGFRGGLMDVELKIFDVLGREVATLVNKPQAPGIYKVQFNASNLASGVYFYKLKYGSFLQTKKMILLK